MAEPAALSPFMAIPTADHPRSRLESDWLHLTRVALPVLAGPRGWPVRHDHCFQRILLDHAHQGRWYDHIAGRPAYRHAAADALVRAIALGRAAIAGEADMHDLDRRSLHWRGKSVR